MGNLTRDPEIKYTPKGIAVGTVSLAVNRTWKDASTGEKKEEVSFINCTAFGRTAEVIGQYVQKGSCLHVRGRLKQDSWEDKTTGAKRSSLGVIIEEMQFIGGNKTQGSDRDKAPSTDRNQAAPKGKIDPSDLPPGYGQDDDVPF